MATDSRYTKWFKISWDQIHQDSKALARKLSAKGLFGNRCGGQNPPGCLAAPDRSCSPAQSPAWQTTSAARPVSSIVAVTRGGLIPAAIIARELEVRLVDTLCISSYDWQSQAESATVFKGVSGTGANCLVIDDLADTGNTAKIVRRLLPDAHFATVYVKPEGKSLVDTFIDEVSQDTWILFPWDSELQYVKPLAECRDENQGAAARERTG